MVGGIALAVTFLTEVTSNTATTTLLMPVLAAAGVAAGIDPAVLMVPATLSASCLHASSRPRIPSSAGRTASHKDAAWNGAVLNMVGVVVIRATLLRERVTLRLRCRHRAHRGGKADAPVQCIVEVRTLLLQAREKPHRHLQPAPRDLRARESPHHIEDLFVQLIHQRVRLRIRDTPQSHQPSQDGVREWDPRWLIEFPCRQGIRGWAAAVTGRVSHSPPGAGARLRSIWPCTRIPSQNPSIENPAAVGRSMSPRSRSAILHRMSRGVVSPEAGARIRTTSLHPRASSIGMTMRWPARWTPTGDPWRGWGEFVGDQQTAAARGQPATRIPSSIANPCLHEASLQTGTDSPKTCSRMAPDGHEAERGREREPHHQPPE